MIRTFHFSLLGLFVLLSFTGLNAQSYYWNNGEKVHIRQSDHKNFYLFSEAQGKIDNVEAKSTRVHNKTIHWAFGNIKKQSLVEYVSPAIINPQGDTLSFSNLFYVKLRDGSGIEQLKQMAKENNVDILGNNKTMPLWYTLSCNKKSTGNALEMTNLFHECGLFSVAEVDFLKPYKLNNCTNDTYFNNQWNLKNSGQNNGTVDIDINFCPTRPISINSQNVVVAVVDEGIQLDHPDLPNIHPYSYSTATGTTPSQVYGSHGTACAGIIGAQTNNNLGVAGIASGSVLMSISHNFSDYSLNTSERLADGINAAWRSGASVISNSWGGGSNSSYINDAIDSALIRGRNGKGCVVVFATGNNNTSVSYPANSNPDIIAVGAMSPCGERKKTNSCDGEWWWGSNYGIQLDIVAPGVLIPTTDLTGSDGYDPSDYYGQFNGTSSATPHVAGVAALVLSVNPNLTQKEVANIIESTARKVGSYNYQYNTPNRPNGSWNEEMGYGLVDAYAAVLAAEQVPPISGDTITYSLSGPNATILETLNITPAGVIVKIQNPDYVYGAMISLRNLGLNDSIIVEWFGGFEQNNLSCANNNVNLFGNGAQISNFVSPKLGNGDVLISIRSATDQTYSAEIRIYNWMNGQGCLVNNSALSLNKSKNSVASFAPAAAVSYPCGASGFDLECIKNEDGTLNVSGVGRMADYAPNNGSTLMKSSANTNPAPWNPVKNVVIGSGVTYIGKNTFDNTSLQEPMVSVKVDAEIPPIVGDSAFFQGRSTSYRVSLFVPQSRITDYKTASVWKDFRYINPSTVMFNAQNETAPTTQLVSYEEKATRPATDPVRTGFTFEGWYKEGATETLFDFNTPITSDITLLAKWGSATSVTSPDRVIPTTGSSKTAAVPVGKFAANVFTVGPNPAVRSSGSAAFFWQGALIVSASLSVYNADGNIVKSLSLRDNAVGTQSKRRVGSWDLKDANGRLVSTGTYLVKGAITTAGGKKELVSLVLGVN